MAFDILCGMVTVLVILQIAIAGDDDLPANFVFGDSLVDVGNNNYFASLSKANHPPNGIDFGYPTGRYTNNRTIVDIIGQQIGLKGFTPPYLAPSTKGSVILLGVNYASGGGGIFNESGQIFFGRINMDAQLDNFANTRQDIISTIGAPAAQKLLRKAVYSITMGSNDFLNNYLVPVISVPEQKLVPPEVYIANLISRYRLQLTRLYNLGARKVIVVNVGPIGCIPYARDIDSASAAGDSCSKYPNQLAQSFNSQLKNLVAQLRASLMGSHFVYANVYGILDDILKNYRSYGFENPNSACCHVPGAGGRHGGIIPCAHSSIVCTDRSKYIFWDPYHPTDAANVIMAKRLLDGDSHDISPINVRQLFAV